MEGRRYLSVGFAVFKSFQISAKIVLHQSQLAKHRKSFEVVHNDWLPQSKVTRIVAKFWSQTWLKNEDWFLDQGFETFVSKLDFESEDAQNEIEDPIER